MVESCFSEDFLKAWNCHSTSSAPVDAKERLSNLMQFIKAEVEDEERINLAMSGFGLNEPKCTQSYKKKQSNRLHDCYKIWLRDLDEKFACNFDASDQDKICEDVQSVCNGSWIRELKEDNIILADVNDSSGSIYILIGADIMGEMLTGKRKMLKSGLVAVENLFRMDINEKSTRRRNPKRKLSFGDDCNVHVCV
ncbi:uncharacterized protein TNCV_1827951 [Trichonephila clavipes]|nr:uncharacterized protein TNCV_1827951 [Trichonephila clavipes]